MAWCQSGSGSAAGGGLGGGEQRFEQVDGAGCGALLAEDERAGASAQRLAGGLVVQEVANLAGEVGRIADDPGGVGREQEGDDVAEVAGVGAEQDGRTVGGGLDHVLTAATGEAAADEGNVGEAPAGSQFTERIEQQDGAGWASG